MFGSARNKLTPAWRYRASGIVWRVVPTVSGKLIGETRDVQNKLASFFCLNLRTGEVLWEDARFGEPWWIGIEAVHNDTLLLHKFATPELPEHRALIAVDVLTGSELWRNEGIRFDRLESEAIAVTRTQAFGGEQLRLDYRTGEVVEESRPAEVDRDTLVDAQPEIDLPSPRYELEGDDLTNTLLRQHCDMAKVVYPVDCIDLDALLVCSIHEKISASTDERPCMMNTLLVVDKGSGDLRFREVINKQAWAVVPDAFFVWEGMLIYVHERATLTAMDLHEQ